MIATAFPAACSIRSARPEDATQIARLAATLGYPNDAEAMRARLRELAAISGHWVAVACGSDSEAALGWVHVARCITLETGEYAEILGLVVDAAARRGGVGRSLVAAAERWAREQRLPRITVRSNAARVESHPFYAALGYQRPKTQHVYMKTLADTGGS
jgi:GNAT superfamily N-acetyltransferase